jgi:hypothetical protein
MTYGSFYDYDDGIYQPEPGEEEKGGHAVQVAGWGLGAGVDHWIWPFMMILAPR